MAIDLTFAARAPFNLGEQDLAWVSETYERLTDEQRAGQLFLMAAMVPDPALVQGTIAVAEPAGFMLRPMPTTAVTGFTAAIRAACSVPPLLAANLDIGPNGAASDATAFASELAIGATGNVEHARRAGLVAGREAAAMGINWQFGPVADLLVNDYNPITGTRAFGTDAELVAPMVRAYIEAIQSAGVAASAKHWPGDGVDDRDQHLVTTYNSLTVEEWDRTYGRVWKEAIDAGTLTVMAAHIALPAYSAALAGKAYHEALPASLSYEITTTLLREKLGFNGLVVTDASVMAGMQMAMPRAQAVPASIAAGCDIFLFSMDYAADYGYLLDGLASGALTRERFTDAVLRVLALKATLGLHRERAAAPVTADVLAEHRAWARECLADATTLVKDLEGVLPLDPTRHRRVLIYPLDGPKLTFLSGGPERPTAAEALGERLRQAGFEVTVHSYPEHIDFAVVMAGKDAVPRGQLLAEYDLVLYVASIPNASNGPTVRITWLPLTANNLPMYAQEIPTVFVSMENPYHLRDVPRVRTFVNAYCDTPANVDVVADKLLGLDTFRGTSPIDPFCGYPEARF